MLSTGIPTRFVIPFASSASVGFIRSVPVASQIGIQDGAASLTDGFPPLTMTTIAGGGKWPFGQDFNGILKQITQWNQWQAAGGQGLYDSTFATAAGGYPKGAILATTLGIGIFWMSTADNNTTNPDTGGANWVSFSPVNLYATDFGTANTGAISTAVYFNPPAASYFIGLPLRVKKIGSVNTGAYTLILNGLGAFPVVNTDGTPLTAGSLPASGVFTVIYDGTSLVLQSSGVTPRQLQIQPGNYAVDSSGTANAIVVAFNPAPINLGTVIGSSFRVQKSPTGNSGPCTINVNGLGVVNIIHGNGFALQAGELPPNATFTIVWDGANFILQSVSSPRLIGPFPASIVGAVANPVINDIGRAYLFSSLGSGSAQMLLPSAAVVGPGWWVRVHCVNAALGDFGSIQLTGGQLLDGLASRQFGQDTDVILKSDGANFFTESGSYARYGPQYTIGASTVLAFVHNLKPINGPGSIQTTLYWVNVIPEAGYSLGDILEGKLTVINGAGATNTVGLVQDVAGDITRVITSVTLVAPHKSTTTATNLTYANWKLVIRVEAH